MFKFITLFANDMNETAKVYQAIGLSFVQEQHGSGPIHLAHEKDGFVLEIYQKHQPQSDAVMLGFDVENLPVVQGSIAETAGTVVKDTARIDGTRRMIIADPEGRQIYLQEAKPRNV